jgi:hypothetical protein
MALPSSQIVISNVNIVVSFRLKCGLVAWLGDNINVTSGVIILLDNNVIISDDRYRNLYDDTAGILTFILLKRHLLCNSEKYILTKLISKRTL